MARPVIPEVNVQEEVNTQATTRFKRKPFDEIVNELRQKEGVKIYHNVRIKNVTIGEKDGYPTVSFTIDRYIPGRYFNKETNQWDLGDNNTVYSYPNVISGIMKEDEDLVAISDIPVKHPERILRMFGGGELVILQEPVLAGDYVNPFSTTGETKQLKNDTTINHIIGIKLGKYGQMGLNKLSDNMFLD